MNNHFNIISFYLVLVLFININKSKSQVSNVVFKNLIEINSVSDDFGLTFPIDSNIYYFTSSRVGQVNKHNIYCSNLVNGKFSNPNLISDFIPLNVNLPDNFTEASISSGSCYISPSGNEMYFSSCDYGFGECDIYSCQKLQILPTFLKTWNISYNLGLKINTSSWDSQPCLSPIGDILVFSSNRAGGFGGRDIWFSFRKTDGSWDYPINAGENVNTNYDEVTPSFSPDKSKLYFSSNGRSGLGGFDVFFVNFNELLTNRPINFKEVNSVDDDLFFVQNYIQNKSYISSNRKGGIGGLDIYEITNLKSEIFPYLLVKGFVYDFNKMPVFAEIEVSDPQTGKLISKSINNKYDGDFYQILMKGKSYILTAKVGDLLFESKEINVQKNLSKLTITELNFNLQNIGDNLRILLSFKNNSSIIQSELMGDLSRLTKFLISNKKYRIEITGFSDDAIEPSTNQYLAALRGNSVKDYLIGNGINSDRISVNEVSATKEIIDLNPNQYVRIKLIR